MLTRSISDLFYVNKTTTVTMFAKSLSLDVVKPQVSLTFRSLALTSSNVEVFSVNKTITVTMFVKS